MGKKGADGEEQEVTPQDQKMVGAVLGPRHEEPAVVAWMKKDKGKGAWEQRLVVVTAHRFFSFTPKGRIAREAHLLDLEEIASSEPRDFSLSFKGWKIAGRSSEADEIINGLRLAYETAFAGVPPEERFKLAVEPESRLVEVSRGETICGGFAATYQSLCNFFSTPVREDICWDVNNLYPSNNVTEFNLQEFEQPVSVVELAALIGALKHNSWFTSFVAKDMTLDKKTFTDIAQMLRKNKTITKLVLSNVGMTREGLIEISKGITENKANSINTIDFSKNSQLDDKAMAPFAQALATLSHGMVNLDISNCSFGKSGMQTFGNHLRKNAHMPSTLSQLNVSKNVLSTEGSSALAQFLANPNTMRHLDVSSTESNLETLLPAVVRGSSELQTLRIGGNKLSAKSVNTMTSQFLKSSASLKVLDVSNTSVTVKLLGDIVKAIGSNMYLQDFDFDCSANKLGLEGAKMLGNLGVDAKNIVRFNVADNDFGDDGMAAFCTGLIAHEELRFLDVSRNFSAKGTKTRDVAIDNFIDMVSNPECSLETLVFRGSRSNALRLDIAPFLYGLATNDKLHRLDISGQQMGNKGAMALGKVLQVNKTLTELRWDENGTTLPGFTCFRNGIIRNRALKDMQMPILDVAASLKSDDAKTLQKVLADIQDVLARNHNPKSMLGAQGSAGSMFGHLNMMNSGERDRIERLRMKIRSMAREADEDEKKVMEDAENNDSAMSYLHLIAEEHQVQMADEVTSKLREMANEIIPVVDKHYRDMIGRVMDTVGEKYKSMEEDQLRLLNRTVTFTAKELEAETVQKIMSGACAAEIQTKANDAFMSALEITTDYIFEKLADRLEDIVEGVQKQPARESYRPEEPEEEEEEEAEVPDETSAAAPPPSRPDRPDRPSRPPKKAAPPIPGSPGGRGRGRGRGRGGGVKIPTGLENVIGGGMGGPPPRKPPADDIAPEPPTTAAAPAATPPAKKDKKKLSKSGGLFGSAKKKKPAPSPVKPVPKMAKPKKPSGETANMKEIPTEVNSIKTHMTKDRPMVQRKRRPPTRRPRGPAAQG